MTKIIAPNNTKVEIPKGKLQVQPGDIIRRGDTRIHPIENREYPFGYSVGNRIEGVYLNCVILRPKEDFTLASVRNELAHVGVTIRKMECREFVVRIKGSPRGQTYVTSDLLDARATGFLMATAVTARFAPDVIIGVRTQLIRYLGVMKAAKGLSYQDLVETAEGILELNLHKGTEAEAIDNCALYGYTRKESKRLYQLTQRIPKQFYVVER